MESGFLTSIILQVVAGVLLADVLFLRAQLWKWLRRKDKNLVDDIRPDGGGPRAYHMKTIEFHYSMVAVLGIFFIALAFFLDLRLTSSGLLWALTLTAVAVVPVSLCYLWGVDYLYSRYWYMLTGRQNHFTNARSTLASVKHWLTIVGRSFDQLAREIETLFTTKDRSR